MSSTSTFRKALIFAGIAAVAARPHVIARNPIASGSYVPVAASVPVSQPAVSAAPSAPASVPYSAPYSAPAASVPYSAPAVVSAAPSSPPSVAPVASTPPVTPTSTTTTPLPAVPTWHIDMEVGSSTFNIGDADPSTFEGLWANVCGPDGCDGGSPQEYDFNDVSGGIEGKNSGTFTMSGNIDNNQIITNDLLDAINAALQASKQCSTVPAEVCMNSKRSPETGPIALDCSNEQVTQCTMANYIQATIYDDTSSQKGQITMTAESNPDTFDCSSFMTAMSGAATGLDLDPPVQGAVTLLSLVCLAAGGK